MYILMYICCISYVYLMYIFCIIFGYFMYSLCILYVYFMYIRLAFKLQDSIVGGGTYSLNSDELPSYT